MPVHRLLLCCGRDANDALTGVVPHVGLVDARLLQSWLAGGVTDRKLLRALQELQLQVASHSFPLPACHQLICFGGAQAHRPLRACVSCQQCTCLL